MKVNEAKAKYLTDVLKLLKNERRRLSTKYIELKGRFGEENSYVIKQKALMDEYEHCINSVYKAMAEES